MRRYFSLPSRKYSFQHGFTIIELLVVIIILLAVGGIVGGIFFVSLRSAAKSNKIAIVRQNGNAAITRIIRTIRYTQDFVGVATGSSGPFDRTCGEGATNPLPFNYLQTLDPDATNVPVVTTLYCPVNGGVTNDAISLTTGSNPPNYLTDPQVSKVKNCQITCVKQATGSYTVTVKFTMTDANDSTGLFENSVSDIPFETSVTLRNSQQ